MEIDLAEVERELCRIPEVRAARIVADSSGAPVEVHVLATPGKAAKQVVRDVQSVAMASVGLDLDHRIVSVVQLDEDGGNGHAAVAVVAEPPARGRSARGRSAAAQVADEDEGAGVADAVEGTDRVLFESLAASRRGLTGTAEVVLRMDDRTATGAAEGSAAASATLRTVAEATLDALRQLDDVAARASVETAVIIPMGDRQVALTTVTLVVPPHEEFVTGSAPVRGGGEHEALARAVLDALNRRLAVLH